ncbi:nicotinamide riboside transporter PnuC [Peijinzhouia sedimentorum]
MEGIGIWEGLREGIQHLTLLEATAVFFGLLSVWYSRLENILVFPTGIISVLIYVYICFGAKLYADVGINAYYFIMSIYGWYLWSRKDSNNNFLPITTNSTKEWIISIATLIGSFILIAYSLINFTDSDVPYWDALTTSMAFVAMLLMAKKKIENWIAWIFTNLLSIPLYFYKGLMLTSFQFLIFLILAIMGFTRWRRELSIQKNL